VAENVQATAYLTIDELSSIIEGPLVNGSTHGDINSKTDIIIFGELDREKDWHEGKKHLKILKELSGPRKKPLLFIHFKDFMNINENIANGCKGMSCVARFEGKKPPPPGPLRTRGVCFGNTLISTGGILNDKGKPTMTGFYYRFFH
jgi:hypothetical protein